MPFLQAPLLDEVRYLGTGPVAEAILRGTYQPPPGTDPYAVKLLPFLRMDKRIANAPPVCSAVTMEDHVAGWKKAKEYTACGPTGKHLGVLKVGALHPDIAQFDATMNHIPLVSGYSPLAW